MRFIKGLIPVLLVAMLCVAFTGTASASQGRASRAFALKTTADFMHNNCSDGFVWACRNTGYSVGKCFAAGKHSWYCHGAVREGTPNRIVLVTLRIQGHRIASSHLYPTKRLGRDVVH